MIPIFAIITLFCRHQPHFCRWRCHFSVLPPFCRTLLIAAWGSPAPSIPCYAIGYNNDTGARENDPPPEIYLEVKHGTILTPIFLGKKYSLVHMSVDSQQNH